MIRRSCRDLRSMVCGAALVVVITATWQGSLIKITSCASHAAEWIWDLRDKYPGHTGIRTRRIDGRDR